MDLIRVGVLLVKFKKEGAKELRGMSKSSYHDGLSDFIWGRLKG
jgi:hypothetical protein